MATAPRIARQPPKARGCLRTSITRLLKLGLLLALLSTIALIGWLRSDDFQQRAQGAAEAFIEHQTGEQLSMSRVDIRYWPPAVEVQGLNLFDQATGETILSIQKLGLPLVFTWRGPRLGRVRLERPLFQLHIEEGKLREFANAVKNPDAKPITELPFSGVEVIDGQLRLFYPKGEVGLSGIRMYPIDGREHTLRADLNLFHETYVRTFPLSIDHLVLAPTEIRIPDLDLVTDPLDVRGRVRIPLVGELDIDLHLLARLPAYDDLLPPPHALHGELAIDLELRGLPQNPTAVLTAHGTGLGLDKPGKRSPLLRHRFNEMTLAATLSREQVVVEDLVARWGGGTIRISGLIDPTTRELLDGRAVGDSLSLHDLLTQLDGAPHPWIDMSCDAEIRANGSLHPLHLTGDFDFNVADLHVTNGPVRGPEVTDLLNLPFAWARGSLVLEKDHIHLIAPEVRGPKTSGKVDVDIGFEGRGPLDLRFDMKADLSDFQPLAGVELGGRGPISGRIVGPFNALTFEGTADLEAFSVLGIPFADRLQAPVFRSDDLKSIELLGATASVGQSQYGGDYRFDFRPPMSMTTTLGMTEGRIEDILGIFLDLDGIKGTMTGELNLDGPVFDMNGSSTFRFADVEIYGERFPEGSSQTFMDEGIFTLDELRFSRRDRTEGVLLRGTVGREWALNMDLIADGFTLEGIDNLHTTLPLSGKLAAHARIDNTLFEPAPQGRLTLQQVRYDGQRVEDSTLNFTTSSGITSLKGDLIGGAILGEGTLGLWGEQPYAITAEFNDFPAHLFYPKGADGSPVRAEASGGLAIAGHFGPTPSPLSLLGELDDVQVAWSGHELRNRSPWTYRQLGEDFSLENFDLLGGRTDFALSATGGSQLELDGRGVVELDLLRAVVPGLQRAEGTGKVVLDVEGKAPNLEAVVDIDLDADLLRYESIPAAFEELTAKLHITADQISIEDLEGSIGGGHLSGGGTINTDDWSPSRYDLFVDVYDAQVQWVDSLPPAIGDAHLRFDGPSDALLLSGEVRVEDMVFADRIDWEDWVVEYRSEVMVDPTLDVEGTGLFDMNVRIEADHSVRLRNNLAEGIASADLRIIGNTARPGITGWARVDDGAIVLQDRTFRVDRGEISYDDPWSWDPNVDFDLVTDIESRQQRYRINYQLFGPFSDWRTTTRSDPALPQADVNALLWFGVTTDELEQSGELPTAVAQGVADLLLTDLFASTQASELKEVPDLLFDSIDVATGVNGRGEYSAEPRLVVRKRLSEFGDVDLSWEFNLGRPEDNYIRVDKSVGGIWSIAGWYATLQRDRVLPIGGAYGVDLKAQWEMD